MPEPFPKIGMIPPVQRKHTASDTFDPDWNNLQYRWIAAVIPWLFLQYPVKHFNSYEWHKLRSRHSWSPEVESSWLLRSSSTSTSVPRRLMFLFFVKYLNSNRTDQTFRLPSGWTVRTLQSRAEISVTVSETVSLRSSWSYKFMKLIIKMWSLRHVYFEEFG